MRDECYAASHETAKFADPVIANAVISLGEEADGRWKSWRRLGEAAYPSDAVANLTRMTDGFVSFLAAF